MQDFSQIPEAELSLSLRNFRKIIFERGWTEAKYANGTGAVIFAKRPDGKEIRFSYGTPPNMSYGAGMIADDKYVAYRLMNEIGVRQPETLLLKAEDFEETDVKQFLDRYSPIVIKPVDGAHGAGVFVGVRDLDEAKSAIAKAAESSFTGKVLLQKQLFPKSVEVRAICIDYKFVKAYARIPACVTGDGKRSVVELIDFENETKRTAQYKSNLSYINKEKAVDYLQKQALSNGLAETEILNSVPNEGEKVRVMGVCNTGQGGTMEDITEAFPDELKKTAERIARYLDLPLVGVDFLDDYVIEVNKAPALYHPVDGGAICIKKFVEYLEKI